MDSPRYFPYAEDAQILRTALKPLALDAWIEVDRNLAGELHEKHRLLAERHDDVALFLQSSRSAGGEVLRLLVEHLITRYPDWYRRGNGMVEVVPAALRVDLSERAHPLETAARLVQEDLCVLEASAAGYRLTGAVLCAPSYWRLADKLGKPLLDVHAPVPGYAAKLAAPVDRVFAALRPDRPVWRVNWSVTNSPRLFQPSRDEPDPQASDDVTAEDAGERLIVRVERQTIRRLPETRAILFTIKVYVDALARVAEQPGMAAALRRAIEALSEAELDYKSMRGLRAPLLSYLARFAGV